MKVNVHMLAYAEPYVIREVLIPDDHDRETADGILDAVYYFGQNDFQQRLCPSVSMGDVIELPDGSLHIVRACGFGPMSRAEFAAYKALPRRDRVFSQFVSPQEEAAT